MTRTPRTTAALRRTTATLAATILTVMTLAICALWSVPAHADPALPIPPRPPQRPGQASAATGLTPAEQAMCEKDVAKCGLSADSRTFAFANDNQVAGIANAKPNDKVDAARHCLWQLSLSAWFGTDYAAQWGDVHEQNGDAMETHAMDLHNNIVARSLANDPTLKNLVDQANADLSAPNPAGDSPVVDPSDKDAVNQQIIALCTTAIGQAVQVAYAPGAGPSLPDQLVPDPRDRFVYLSH
ncbi:DUF6973 domain-containing protein [Actinoallomurus rhizosphaericola]|uniref:DUF6973 domain-containing protein n=1 Tax=Actinoallomurus rhizosphaericola TaxID=2952536 RepID=UPI002090454B|nr:hypothetical protein [Actinoallomurus rhizosphaericola]MCO5994357.1 hypothetical protein [Actinoallomurus rhizosphaericola]